VGNLARVRAALAAGAAINRVRIEPLFFNGAYGGGTALGMAAVGDHVEVVEELLARGADPDAQVPESGGALMQTVKFDSRRAAAALLAGGASVDQRSDEKKWTSLHHAALHGNAEFVQLLCGAGADVDACTVEGDSPVFICARALSMRLGERENVGDFLSRHARGAAVPAITKDHVAALRLLQAAGGTCIFDGKPCTLKKVKGMGAEGLVQAGLMSTM